MKANDFYHTMCHPSRSRWHYQQRRVRARRERLQKRINQYKRAYPGCKIQIIIKENRRKVVFLPKGELCP